MILYYLVVPNDTPVGNPHSIALLFMLNVQAFYKSDLESVSVWRKLTGQKHRANAVLEINNLLSERPILEVSGADVQRILRRYNLNLLTDFNDGSVRGLYMKYLRYCFEDNHLDQEESERLRHLKRILRLSEKDVTMANHRVCQEVYARALDQALEDQRLDQKERLFLKGLRQKLQLPAAVADSVYQHKAQATVIRFIKGAVADQRLSPTEAVELKVLIDHLAVDPQWAEQTQAELAKYRLFWQIENEPLPQVFVPISLRSGELCHFLCDAVWYDALADPSLSVVSKDALQDKLANSAYWRNTHPGSLHLSPNAWRQGESGKLYLTNRHLVFRSAEVEVVINLNTITDFDHYQSGLLLSRRKKAPLFLDASGNADVLAMMLGRVLREL